MQSKKEEYYKSGSLALVCFLRCKGEQIVGIKEYKKEGRKEFVFVRSKNLNQLIDNYKFGDRYNPGLLVSVHLYEQIRRELIDLLNGK